MWFDRLPVNFRLTCCQLPVEFRPTSDQLPANFWSTFDQLQIKLQWTYGPLPGTNYMWKLTRSVYILRTHIMSFIPHNYRVIMSSWCHVIWPSFDHHPVNIWPTSSQLPTDFLSTSGQLFVSFRSTYDPLPVTCYMWKLTGSAYLLKTHIMKFVPPNFRGIMWSWCHVILPTSYQLPLTSGWLPVNFRPTSCQLLVNFMLASGQLMIHFQALATCGSWLGVLIFWKHI